MDTFKLQNDLNKIYKWTKDNHMELNAAKFEYFMLQEKQKSKVCFKLREHYSTNLKEETSERSGGADGKQLLF